MFKRYLCKKDFRLCILFNFPLKKSPFLNLLPHLSTHPSDNRHIIKANVFSNRLVCAVDQEDTICSVPGKRMTPATIIIPNHSKPFSLFLPRYIADPNLLFVRKPWLVMRHYECHKVSIWPGVIEHDGPHNSEIPFSALCCVINTFILLICWMIFPSIALFLGPIWAKLWQLGEGLNSQDTQRTHPPMLVAKKKRLAHTDGAHDLILTDAEKHTQTVHLVQITISLFACLHLDLNV